MKAIKTALLGAAWLAAASSANAADVYEGGDGGNEALQQWPTSIWAGLYLGGHVGSTFDDTVSINDVVIAENDEALLLGVHAGYNWQRGSLVYGLELDLGDIDDEFQLNGAAFTSYLATVRARLGYAFGNTLLYGTGGLAIVGIDEDSDPNDAFDDSLGFVVGAGLDHKFTSHWSLGAEGLYYDVTSDAATNNNVDLDREFWTIRARVTYHIQD